MEFPTWLRDKGGKIHQELDLFRTLASGDRGVVANGDIAEGELLLLLPIDCALYIPTEEEYNKRPDTFPEAVRYLRGAHPGLSPFLATTLALMSEVARGSASPWAAYVATLPPSCPDCLLNWTEDDKADLEGTSLEQSGPDPAADVYRRHVAPILAARPDLWPGLGKAESEGAAGLAAFVGAASLVQSRAFHLEAENWVSGAKEISKLEDGGTQVFLLPGIDMINHSHNPARRNAHLERLNWTQAAAAKLLDAAAASADTAASGAAAAPGALGAFFVMRADKPIKAGEEVLHTYGNLSDAQLLQTYGFLDSEDDFRPQAAEGPSPKKRAKTEAAADAAADAGGGVYRNPYNAALVPWSVVEEVCTGLLRSMDQAPPAALQRAKQDFLAACGVLQPAAPESTQFVLLAREPLPDELMTAVQVLLMTKDEFHELRREFLGSGPEKSGGGKGSSGKGGGAAKGKAGKAKAGKAGGAAGGAGGEAAAGSASAPAAEGGPAVPKLALGTTLLEEDEDFAEMACITSLQVLEACLERYPSSVKEDVRRLKNPQCTGRERLAVRVRLGEKDVLQLAKKAVVDLMRRLRDGAAGEAKGDAEEQQQEEAAATAAGRRPASRKRRRGLGAAAEDGDGEAAESSGGEEGEDEEPAEGEEDDGLLMGSDDSEKVGYGAEDYDDGPGEAHDRGGAHEAPKED